MRFEVLNAADADEASYISGTQFYVDGDVGQV